MPPPTDADSPTPSPGDNDTIPGSFMTHAQLRKLKIAVITMGVMLVAGFGVVLVAIVYQASQLGGKSTSPRTAQSSSTAQPATETAAALRQRYRLPEGAALFQRHIPQGAALISAAPSPQGFVLTLKEGGGISVLLFEPKSWTLQSLTRLTPPPTAQR